MPGRIGAVLIDFDGTACPHDVSEELLEAFGEPGWIAYDEAVDRGEMGLREAAHHQAAMLRGSREEMLAHALGRFGLDPTFPPFVRWAEGAGLELAMVSDGFAFYLRPMLEAAGVGHLTVITNEMAFDGGRPELLHPSGHPLCVGCGTCKMLAARSYRERFGRVAFVGEGQSDRYGALYSDLVFAKDHLVTLCERDGVPYLAWETFDDVRRGIEAATDPPAPLAPPICPGWTDPA
ncbi:MAG: HAD-IB family phosphatase [Actinobacteria bacterium]|nr:HAD-IB family phosphatase [Actinomycetota bacterium]